MAFVSRFASWCLTTPSYFQDRRRHLNKNSNSEREVSVCFYVLRFSEQCSMSSSHFLFNLSGSILSRDRKRLHPIAHETRAEIQFTGTRKQLKAANSSHS